MEGIIFHSTGGIFRMRCRRKKQCVCREWGAAVSHRSLGLRLRVCLHLPIGFKGDVSLQDFLQRAEANRGFATEVIFQSWNHLRKVIHVHHFGSQMPNCPARNHGRSPCCGSTERVDLSHVLFSNMAPHRCWFDRQGMRIGITRRRTIHPLWLPFRESRKHQQVYHTRKPKPLFEGVPRSGTIWIFSVCQCQKSIKGF